MTTAITMDQARAMGNYLATEHGAKILPPDAAPVVIAKAILDIMTLGVPVAVPLLDDLLSRSRRVSVTVATPYGILIVLSPEAVSTAESYVTTIAHEVEHARQIEELGPLQSVVDYLGSSELRAVREGSAYVVGLWASFLVTGVVPRVEDAMVSLGSGLYHLAQEEVDLGRGVVTSGVEAIRAGAIPPYSTAMQILQWLRLNAPEAIIPEGHRS